MTNTPSKHSPEQLKLIDHLRDLNEPLGVTYARAIFSPIVGAFKAAVRIVVGAVQVVAGAVVSAFGVLARMGGDDSLLKTGAGLLATGFYNITEGVATVVSHPVQEIKRAITRTEQADQVNAERKFFTQALSAQGIPAGLIKWQAADLLAPYSQRLEWQEQRAAKQAAQKAAATPKAATPATPAAKVVKAETVAAASNSPALEKAVAAKESAKTAASTVSTTPAVKSAAENVAAAANQAANQLKTTTATVQAQAAQKVAETKQAASAAVVNGAVSTLTKGAVPSSAPANTSVASVVQKAAAVGR